MGNVETLIVCKPSFDGQTVLPCPSGMSPTTISAYVFDGSAAAQIQALTQPVDYQLAAEMGSIGFGIVVVFAVFILAFRVSKSALRG